MKNGLKVKTKIRIGKICYTNCLPFYHNFQSPESCDLDFYKAVPTEINLAMRQGKIDIAPISSLEYLNHQKKYLLLEPCVIGARDFSGSVLLFSHKKIEELNNATIALSRESLSSAALLKILLKFKYKFQNEFVEADSGPEEMLERCEAALVIGDRALFYRHKDFVYKNDLSEIWWNWTEKPFCFAVWAVRREFAEDFPEETAAFLRNLKKNLDKNLGNIEGLLKEGLKMTFLDVRFSKVFGYLFNLSYGLDKSMREGLELFYRLAHRLNVSPRFAGFESFKAPQK